MKCSASSLLLSLFFCIQVNAQTPVADSTNTAPVIVLVTDMQNKPAAGEEVVFKSADGFAVSGVSDAKGNFRISLPAGKDFIISVKSITDSTKSGKISIPKPGPGEFFSEPFTVRVRFNASKVFTLHHVLFDFNQATIRTESYPELYELVKYMQHKPLIRIEVAGHTDNIGQDADNLKLSQNRAAAIRNFLIQKGIAAARITAKGYGASQPVSDNNTEEGRQLNRRTEIRISD